MTDNATRALEILNQLGEQLAILRDDPKRMAATGAEGVRIITDTANGAATVYALLAIADAIRETGKRGPCGAENPHRYETCVLEAGHGSPHRSGSGSKW